MVKVSCTMKIEHFVVLKREWGEEMIQFEKELEKFKPVLEINHIEEHIANEEIKDIIDLLKVSQQVNEQGN